MGVCVKMEVCVSERVGVRVCVDVAFVLFYVYVYVACVLSTEHTELSYCQ